MEALEFVADEPNTLELLEQLVNKSLVMTEERRRRDALFHAGDDPPICGREKLFEAKQASTARDRHFIHYKNIDERLMGCPYSQAKLKLQRLISMQVEMENLRAAFEWGLQNHVQDALELAANMAMSVSMAGRAVERNRTIIKSAMEKFRPCPCGGRGERVRKEIYAHGCFSLGTLLQGTNEIVPAAVYCRRQLRLPVSSVINKYWALAWKCTRARSP